MQRPDLKGLTKSDILKLIREKKVLLKRDYTEYKKNGFLCSTSEKFIRNMDELCREGYVEELLYKEYKEKYDEKYFQNNNKELHVLTKVYVFNKSGRINKIESLLEAI